MSLVSFVHSTIFFFFFENLPVYQAQYQALGTYK